MKSFETVSPALNYLPTFAKRFLQKQKLPIPYLRPVRRNCLSGSGKEQECHANCYALSKQFGGEPVNGISISLFMEDEKPKNIYLTDHTVWKTPENKLVDVTAHNFSDKNLVIFAPISSLFDKKFAFPSVEVRSDYLKRGVLMDFRSLKANAIIASMMKVEEIFESPEKSALVIPSSRMESGLFRLIENVCDDDYFAELEMSADFSLPSTATGKYWNEITEINNMREINNESKQ